MFFGEGIDLVGDRLCGAAVVGVGLPGVTLEHELIRKYYQEKEKLGFEFAYQFPVKNLGLFKAIFPPPALHMLTV